jgi:type IV pilus assembly protein PilB
MATTSPGIALSGLARRLVMDGHLDEATAQAAHEKALADKQSLVSHLVNDNGLDSRIIAQAASQEFGVPMLDLDAINIENDVVKSVDDKLLTKHNLLPLYKRGRKLFVAISDPTRLNALDDIKFQSGLQVEPIVGEELKISKMLESSLQAMETSMDDLVEDDFDLEDLDIGSGEEELEDEGGTDADDAPVVKFVNKMLLDAIHSGASDLHWEPYEKFYRVRFRTDGILREVVRPPQALAGKIAARIKVLCRLDISERRIPQDGRMKLKVSKTRAIDFRVNTCPVIFGEKIVMRILDPSSASLGIDALGYEPFQKKLYLDNLAKPYGMILVTGPTGSGKTVSLYTGVNILNEETVNISTAEDPAEIQLPGVNQVNVNPKVGLTFESALKAFLRQDPDIILVGEIRDLETASIAIKAASTGHMVLSTLHTNDAPKTLTRMVDMGVKPFAIASSVNLIIAQRLGRRLCKDCKEPIDVPKEALIKEGFTEQMIEEEEFTIYTPGNGGEGCSQCKGGSKGRVGIYQVMEISEATGRVIMKGGTADDIADQAASEGIWDLRRSGLEKVKQGVMSLQELNRVTIE